MDKFKELEKGCYIHVDVPNVVFYKKPPEWIANDLVRVYNAGFTMGEAKFKNPLKDILRELLDE